MPSWNDIKLFFRGIDIAMMRSEVDKTMVLDQFDQVRGNAWTINSRVTSTDDAMRMPPPPYAEWTPQQRTDFAAWMGNPIQQRPEAAQEAAKFIALSKLLTGFDKLEVDPELALKHLHRLKNDAELEPVVSELIEKHDAMDQADFEEQILDGPDPTYREAAQAIILLWYTGAFFDGRFPVDSGTPQDNQYVQGLVWQVIEAHPMGYSTEGGQYWREQPRTDGLRTGLGNTRDRLDSDQ